MKKLLILMLVLFSLSLSACSLNNNKREEKLNQPIDQPVAGEIGQPSVVSYNSSESTCLVTTGYKWCEAKQKCLRDWEEKCEEEIPGLNDSISSEKLGIKVSYYSSPENLTGAKEEGNRIYFYMNGPANTSDYKTGQYLEEFTKDSDASLKSAIESNFLQNIDTDQCFVEIIEDTDEYQKAIINYPDTPCSDGSPAFACNSCPVDYSRSNGISYFLYYKDHPNLFFYLSIGQYSLMAGDPQASLGAEWFSNIEFLK